MSDGASRDYPFDRLAGDLGNPVVVGVVMNDREAVEFRDRCDQQIRRRKSVLAALGEEALHLEFPVCD